MKKKFAEVHFSEEGFKPKVELLIPHGTRLSTLLKVQDLISTQIISKISPRGCQACLSGVDFNIRERLENVMLVDLTKNTFVD